MTYALVRDAAIAAPREAVLHQLRGSGGLRTRAMSVSELREWLPDALQRLGAVQWRVEVQGEDQAWGTAPEALTALLRRDASGG
ncbi:MAG: hypothetical protein H6741_13455 [Alphaproteobacteria bacterium]|nr:hypothetical protein [Alphaproteobacteria bacterium]